MKNNSNRYVGTGVFPEDFLVSNITGKGCGQTQSSSGVRRTRAINKGFIVRSNVARINCGASPRRKLRLRPPQCVASDNVVTNKCWPFLKWAGGKRQLISELGPYLPKTVKRYWEPFCGAAALFFYLKSNNLISEAIISDTNKELMTTYSTIASDSIYLLMNLLKTYESQHCEDFYYQIRQYSPKDSIEIAARMIYLNKTCFNGLYRVNRQGKFNVPFGKKQKINLFNSENLINCHFALKNAVICAKDYKTLCTEGECVADGSIIKPQPGDFIYMDPPYENCFSQYTSYGFTQEDQEALRDLCLDLTQKGIHILVSNSNDKFINDLWNHPFFDIQQCGVSQTIQGKKKQKSERKEVLISNLNHLKQHYDNI